MWRPGKRRSVSRTIAGRGDPGRTGAPLRTRLVHRKRACAAGRFPLRSLQRQSHRRGKILLLSVPNGPVVERYVDFVFQPVRSDIRRDALIRLTDLVRGARTPDEIMFGASRILGETLGASRAGFGVIDAGHDTMHVSRDWQAEGVVTLAGAINLRQFGDFVDDLKAGRPVVIDDVGMDARTQAAAAVLAAMSGASFVDLPVIEDGKLVALFYVNSARPDRDQPRRRGGAGRPEGGR